MGAAAWGTELGLVRVGWIDGWMLGAWHEGEGGPVHACRAAPEAKEASASRQPEVVTALAGDIAGLRSGSWTKKTRFA